MSLYASFRKRLGNFDLNVNFEARKTQVLAILGASGSGKSLTLKCLSGIEKPDEGEIVLDGKVLFSSKKRINLQPQERGIGYLFQNYALFPNMTVTQNIASGIRLKGKAEKQAKVSEMIKKYALQGLEKNYPWQLSGGQQQRVALARIFASNPKVLLLDEPFSALDSNLQWKMEQEIREKISEYRGHVLFVSHRKNEVYRLAKEVAMIDNGLMQTPCEVKTIFERPTSLSALLLTGCENTSRASRSSENAVFAMDWGLSLELGRAVSSEIKYIGIRAEDIKITEEKCSGKNCFTVIVNQIIEDIHSYILVLRSKEKQEGEDIQCLYCSLSKDSPLVIKEGSTLSVLLSQDKLITLNQ